MFAGQNLADTAAIERTTLAKDRLSISIKLFGYVVVIKHLAPR
jgi:hypothetical protein